MADIETIQSQGILKMHKTHTQWRSEHAAWMDKIASYKDQQQQAIAMLHMLDHALPNNGSVLNTLADVIQKHEMQISAHENILAELMAGRSNTDAYTELQIIHKEAAENHEQMRREHDEFRQTHPDCNG